MDRLKQWKMYFDDKKNPCIVTDRDTVELLYCNEAFLKVFKIEEDVIGKYFYDVVLLKDCYIDKKMPDWDTDDFYASESYNKELNIRLILSATVDRGNNVVVCEMKPIYDGMKENVAFEQAMADCMEIFTKGSDKKILSLMEYIGKFYDCEASYVYRFDEEENILYCISQWAENPAYCIAEETQTNYNGQRLLTILNNGVKGGILVFDKESPDYNANSLVNNLMNKMQLRNITICAVEDSNNKIIGVVGLSNRRNMDIPLKPKLLIAISKIVAQDVLKTVVDKALLEMQNRDVLTGLYNRTGYKKKIDQILAQKPKNLGVIIFNINGMKSINEKFGISSGDEHIKKSAKYIQDFLGYDIFRMSGDEFVSVIENIEETDFNNKVTQLHSKMKLEGNYDFSFGHIWEDSDFDLDRILFHAETIMNINKQEYYANAKGKYNSIKDTALSDLLTYIENDEFMIYLQPQVKLEDSSLCGAEALVRRFDKTNNKLVFPDQFISVYEKKSIIRHLDLFVLEKVCELQVELSKQNKQIPISVNFSRVTLQEFGIVDTIAKICDKYNVAKDLIVIEVTERVGLVENNVASSLIRDFKKNGFKISLDDFGSAYSNIVTLAQIEVDEVKIDKSLVDNLISNEKNLILVKNVLSMCNELNGTSTLSEGIENEEQAKILHELGCHLGQGYLYSKPMPVEQFCEKYIQ